MRKHFIIAAFFQWLGKAHCLAAASKAMLGQGFLLTLCCLGWVSTAQAAIPASERAALISLYAATNGASWTDATNWNGAAGTECLWNGVHCSRLPNGEDDHVIGINLDDNNLVGTLPSLSGLPALQWFFAYFNRLSGPIPAFTGLPALQYFDVEDNQLSGPVPSLSGLPALKELWLDDNQLTGPIPSLSGLTALKFVRFDGNKFSGQIPSLAGLKSLEGFDASNNQLSGPIPTLSGLTALKDFAVTGNQLSGSIPSLSGLTALQGLYVDNNQLTGSLPSLSGLAALTILRVTNNQLTGPVVAPPASLTSAQICLNNLVSSGDAAIDAAWVKATGRNWLACQRTATPPTCTLNATPASIASGGTSTLSATCNPAATSYSWTGGTCAGTSAASCTVKPTATTTYTVRGTNSTGTGAAASATVTVTQVVVEYLDTVDFPNSPGGHFFYSSDPAEQAAIDAGAAGAFSRTGRHFLTGGTTPVCRFYGSMSPGPNSHFFTVNADECNALIAAQVTPRPVSVQQWNYEGISYLTTPPTVAANGALSCPAGTLPLYRAYNNAYPVSGPKNSWDSNHRFTPQLSDIAAMVAGGWRDEGMVFCTGQ